MSIPSEVEEFLMTGAPTAVLGYNGSDGRPLVAPVWFLVEDGELVFNTMRDSAKGRALAREPRVAVCVDDPHPPFSFVQLQGVATMTEDHEQLLDTATRIAARYMGADRADEFGQRNSAPGGVVVRVRPTRVVSAFKLQDRER
ncbi:PPOX class probable F420-dependent enzyme [Mycobacterium sp. JS623]|uniref:PPOX class F420-dependent oxidoreductase n=1 Tax=Mycobacterium sp. JS623 TaxID=212767 RepID=UPI0002A5680B|nr:PPOX class F420-dependent oxidoreductase [Mycobacterium sp. JS623]AGB22240.1 PPOX class probable F420-dependent enzyme [Mycobacterium sp. JS623]